MDSQLTIKAEAVKMLLDLAKIADKTSTEGTLVGDKLRGRIRTLESQWAKVGSELNESISGCRSERRRRAEFWIKSRKDLLDAIDVQLRLKIEAVDAEV